MKIKIISLISILFTLGTILLSYQSIQRSSRLIQESEKQAVKEYQSKIEKSYSDYLNSIKNFKLKKDAESHKILAQSLTKYQESMFWVCFNEEKQEKFNEEAEEIAVDSFLDENFNSNLDLFLSNLESKKQKLFSFYQECSKT